jgi:hypothetical protein
MSTVFICEAKFEVQYIGRDKNGDREYLVLLCNVVLEQVTADDATDALRKVLEQKFAGR